MESPPYQPVRKDAISQCCSDHDVTVAACSGGFIVGWWDWKEECARVSIFTTAEEVGVFTVNLLKSYEGTEEFPEGDLRVSEITNEKA